MVLSVFVEDLYVFFRFLYVHVLEKEEKMNCFIAANGTHQVAYGLEGVWSLTSVGSTGVDGSGVVSAI